MRDTVAKRKRGLRVVLSVLDKARRAGWKIPEVRIVGRNVHFSGFCGPSYVLISVNVFRRLICARFVMAHELGHYRRWHWHWWQAEKLLSKFAPNFMARQWNSIRESMRVARERSADADALALVKGSAAFALKKIGRSSDPPDQEKHWR